jgi:hypothetical protein
MPAKKPKPPVETVARQNRRTFNLMAKLSSTSKQRQPKTNRKKTDVSGPILPADEMLEREFLGGILLGPSLWYPASEEDFTLGFHRLIWSALSEMRRAGQDLSLDGLSAHLSSRVPLSEVDSGYLGSLLDGILPEGPATLGTRGRTLRDIRIRRDLLRATETFGQKAADRTEDIMQLLDRRRADDERLRGLARQPQHNGVVDGGELLSDLVAFIKRFVYLSDAQATVLALFAVHSHAFDAADRTPYLHITSAEKQSGKTRLLEVLQLLVAHPWLTGHTSAAALVRKIAQDAPTVLLDESDAAFNGDEDYAEKLRGILNTGYARGGCSSLCVGKGSEQEVKDFPTYCPKGIAGIGRLPDTIADRSIPIVLKRKAPGRQVERFRHRDVEPDGKALAERAAAFASHSIDALRVARPTLPESLSDRRQEVVEPLLAIADLAGGEWSGRTRVAIVNVYEGPGAEDASIRVQLLADILKVFEEKRTDRISSEELATALGEIETSPWAEINRGKNISKNGLSRFLKPFGIYSKTVRFGENTAKGYELEQFTEAFSIYLPPIFPETKRNNVTSQYPCGSEGLFQNVTDTSCDGLKNEVSANVHAAGYVVTDEKRENDTHDEVIEHFAALFGVTPAEVRKAEEIQKLDPELAEKIWRGDVRDEEFDRWTPPSTRGKQGDAPPPSFADALKSKDEALRGCPEVIL